MLLLIIFVLAMALAAANGANDVSKGVATLAGSGVARYRTAIIWGAATTLAGALVSGLFAERMMNLFTNGIVSAKPTPESVPSATLSAGNNRAWLTLCPQGPKF
jgi:PiT family inorganic phosphate transporter